MTTCKQCGTVLAEGQTVCPGCGADVTLNAANENADAEATATASMMDDDTMPDAPAADGAATNVVAGDPTMTTATVLNAASSDAGIVGNPNAPRAATAASSGGMSAATKAIIAVAVAVVAAVALLVWQVQSRRNQSNISAEDMSEIVKTMLPPQQLAVIAGDETKRKDLARQLRQLLGIAEEARAKGFADDPKTKRALESMRTLVLAQSYGKQQREAGKASTPDQLVAKDEIANFLKEPGQMPT